MKDAGWTVENLEREMDYPASVERIASILNSATAAEVLYTTVKATNPTDKNILAALLNYELTILVVNAEK